MYWNVYSRNQHLAPTPVSALIHAATMVTAGVYLLIRSSPLLEYSSTTLLLCLWLGSLTTIFSSLVGLFQQDIKKVIAYSTMSQLAPVYIYLYIYRNQTICVETLLGKDNSQITKARDYTIDSINNHYSFEFFSSSTIIRLFENIISELIRWKFEIISKLVGISEAIRLILVRDSMFKLFIHIPRAEYVGQGKQVLFLSEGVRKSVQTSLSLSKSIIYLRKNKYCLIFNSGRMKIRNCREMSTKNDSEEAIYPDSSLAFKQWLAGLIDGNGRFLASKNGLNSFMITANANDKKILSLLQLRYGGSIKKMSNSSSFKYRIRRKTSLIRLINDINGLIRNPPRLLQMNKLCIKFNIRLIYPKELTFNSAWFSGFVDSKGCIHLDEKSLNVSISIRQTNIFLFQRLPQLFGGKVVICNSNKEMFKYVVSRKGHITNLAYRYFQIFPLKTEKMQRVSLIGQYYSVKLVDEDDWNDVVKLNEWIKFQDRWIKYLN